MLRTSKNYYYFELFLLPYLPHFGEILGFSIVAELLGKGTN